MTKEAKDSEIRFLGDLQRLEVKPGDRFVLTVPGPVSSKVISFLQKQWEELNVSQGKLIVLTDGCKLGVIGQDEAE
jgi:hypothetical protein